MTFVTIRLQQSTTSTKIKRTSMAFSLSLMQNVVDGAMFPMGGDEILVHHLNVPAAHIQSAVTKQAL
jgi:hypothetical protein